MGPESDFMVSHSQKLGDGGTSNVVRGTDRRSGTPVAVKISDTRIARRRITEGISESDVLKEIKTLSNYSHPSIIELISYWEEDNITYTVLELCPNGSLHKYIQRYGSDQKIMPRLLGEVALGLEFLQQINVFHRDVKPHNMLLTSDYHIKIADFGSAVVCNKPTPILEQLKEAGFTGTPEYIPPEMVTLGHSLGTASEIWSYCCLVYEAYSGKSPFQGSIGDDERVIFESIKKCQFIFPPYLPFCVRQIVTKGLICDAEQRPGWRDIRTLDLFTSVDWNNIHEMCNVTLTNADFTSHLDRYLYKGEQVLHSGLIIKTRHLSTKRRILAVTTLPRIFYYDPETFEVKNSVTLDGTTWATADSEGSFSLHTQKRVYQFSDPSGNAFVWAGAINENIR